MGGRGGDGLALASSRVSLFLMNRMNKMNKDSAGRQTGRKTVFAAVPF